MAKQTHFTHPPKGHVALLAYDSANKRWQAVYVDDSGLLQVDAADLTTRIHGWDGAAWRKLPLTWGYSGQLLERTSDVVDGDGDKILTIGSPDSGEIWVVTHIGARNQSTDLAKIDFYAHDGVNAYELYSADPPAANYVVYWSGTLVLEQGDAIWLYFRACLDNDAINMAVSGYKMKVAE